MRRVAVIGCGYFAQFHHEAWARMTDIEVVGVCDADRAKAEVAITEFHENARAFDDAALMLEELRPDIVDIVTPPVTHSVLVSAAASVGADVMCQKPLAPTLDEASAIVETAEAAGIRLAVHENFRFQPWFMQARRLIDDGLLGRLHGVSFRLRPGDGQGPEAYLSRQPYFQQMPRFLVFETAVHFIDTFRMLLGEVTSVYADLRRINPVIAGEDAGHILFHFENGAVGLFDGNRLNDHVAENTRRTMGEMWLEGENGVLRLNGDGELFWKPHGGSEGRHDYVWEDRSFGGDCVYATNRAAVEAWSAGRNAVNQGRAYLRNAELVESIYRSNELGARVTI